MYIFTPEGEPEQKDDGLPLEDILKIIGQENLLNEPVDTDGFVPDPPDPVNRD